MGGDAWRQRGAALSQPPLTGARKPGGEAATSSSEGTGGHSTCAGGRAATWDSAQTPDSSQPPPSPACRTVPTAPPRPGSVQPEVPVRLPETPRAASLSSGRERWSQTTCPNLDPGYVCSPEESCSSPDMRSHRLPTLQRPPEGHLLLPHLPPPAPPGATVSAVLLCSPSTPQTLL